MGKDDRRLVTTPAGETIEVVSDDDWIKLHGWSNAAPVHTNQPGRNAVVKALWEHGAYEDASGLAGTQLYEDAKARGYEGGPTAITGILRKALAPGLDRTIRGKRSYRIALTALPESWTPELVDGDQAQANDDDTNATEHDGTGSVPVYLLDAPADQVEDVVQAVEDVASDVEAIGLDVAQAVATSLLTQVIDIVSTGKADNTTRVEALQAEVRAANVELDARSQRLSTALEYGQRTARDLRQLGDELAAVKAERDGLRTRLRMTEANLTKAINADRGSVIQDAVNAELAKVMRTTPVHRSPDDADTFPATDERPSA